MRQRLDQALVDRGLARSRSRAADLIRRGLVSVEGRAAEKTSELVCAEAVLAVSDAEAGLVSRGGLKLTAALETFCFDPAGRIALDVGASTGGFTQVLLMRGAEKVYAVDTGHDQLDAALRADPRVVSLEGTNARDLDRSLIPEPVGILVADVSFVSLTKVLEPPLALTAAGAILVALVKPQFEVGRAGIGKGGIVRDEALRMKAVGDVKAFLAAQPGWRVIGAIPSPIAGGSGNLEFLIGARRDD